MTRSPFDPGLGIPAGLPSALSTPPFSTSIGHVQSMHVGHCGRHSSTHRSGSCRWALRASTSARTAARHASAMSRPTSNCSGSCRAMWAAHRSRCQ